MNIALDVFLVIFIVLGTYMGARKGLIKSAIGFVGLVAIVIISFYLKTGLASFLIDKLPFFNFGGSLEGLTSINILVYNIIAFVFIFIMLSCVLNIVIAVTGFIDTLLKFTVIWIIPSKIGGAIIGFLEAWVYIFLVVFILGQIRVTSSWVDDSKIGDFILNHTPVMNTILGDARDAANEIYAIVKDVEGSSDEEKRDINISILQIEMKYNLITKEEVSTLISTGKLELDGVMFG